MASRLRSMIGFGNGIATAPQSMQTSSKQAESTTKKSAAAEDVTMQEDVTEVEGFTGKMRLNIPTHFNVGVICMPTSMNHFMLKTMDPVLKDKGVAVDDAAYVDSWKASGTGKTKSTESRIFKTRPGAVDTSCYFMLIEGTGDEDAMVVPVSHYVTVDPVTAPKSGGAHPERRLDVDENAIEQKLGRIAKMEDESIISHRGTKREDILEDGKSKNKISEIPWDYDQVHSDDEELYPVVDAEHEEDPISQPKLTTFGQKMKSLLQQQMEREVDEELQEYSDDDEGSQVSAPGKQQRSSETAEPPSSKKTKTDDEKSLAVEDRVLRFLRQNNGKVPVKGVLAHFNIKQKNEEFRLIQTVIQKCCTMSTEAKDGDKVKYIALKPEFQ